MLVVHEVGTQLLEINQGGIRFVTYCLAMIVDVDWYVRFMKVVSVITTKGMF